MDTNKILLVNSMVYGQSVGSFVKGIINNLHNEQNLYTLIYAKKNKEKPLEGHKLYGLYPPILSGWFINTHFQGIVFHNFKKFAKKWSKNGIIHYLLQQTKPFNLPNSTVTIHDLIPILYSDIIPRFSTKLLENNLKFYSKLPLISTVSNTVKKSLIDYGFDGKIMVTYNPKSKDFYPLETDKEELRKQLNLPLDKKLILSVGSTSPIKNLKILKPLMHNLGKDYRLVRVGNPIANSISFKDIAPETLNKLYNACDCFIMPSLYEGFGLPVLEAFSAGLPVVASDIATFREITGDAAILSEQNIFSYSVSIKDAINNNNEFKAKGLKRSDFFSNEKFKKQITDFYNTI